jgi:hypothetical protein
MQIKAIFVFDIDFIRLYIRPALKAESNNHLIVRIKKNKSSLKLFFFISNAKTKTKNPVLTLTLPILILRAYLIFFKNIS